MAASKDKLVARWIQYLKNNQIVDKESDLETGDLKYKRSTTTKDITRFLESNTDYSEEQINNAIKMVMAKGAQKKQPDKLQNNPTQRVPGRELSTWQQNDMHPGDPRQPANIPRLPSKASQDTPPKKSKYSKDGAVDVEYKDIKEAIKDLSGQDFSEDDVEAVFSILTSAKPDSSDATQDKPSGNKQKGQGKQKGETPPADPRKKEEDTKKLMRIIRDTMTPTQRKMLWRALQAGKEPVSESQINRPDVKAVLKGISSYRPSPSVMNKIPGLRKDKITVADLQKAWADGDAEKHIPQFADDTRDIKYILSKKFGYGTGEIDKVFAQVFGKGADGKPAEPAQSPTIQKLADYAKTNGIDDAIIGFMKREFASELGIKNDINKDGMAYKAGHAIGNMFKRKAVAEEVRDIFTAIVNEERSDQPILAKEFQQTHLGRTKK